MNWIVFFLATYAFFGLQLAAPNLLVIDKASPQFPLILLVFVGLSAPSRVLAWAALVLGVLVDLQPGPMTPPIVGPAALGYLAGAYVITQLRTLVFRNSIITFAALVFVVGIAAHLVTIALYTFRGLPWPLGQPVAHWSANEQLVRSFFDLLYTTAMAIPLGYVLGRTTPVWGFPTKPRHERR